MIAPERLALLSRYLGTLPQPVASRLAQAVELDRLTGGKTLPHDVILESLRPVLRRVPSVDRTLNPLRLFCSPFDDLLSAAPRTQKQKGRIARSTVLPLWNWLARTVTPEALTKYALGVKTAIFSLKPDDAKACAVAFWPVAARAIAQALDSESKRKSARAVLGGALAVADAQEIASLLAAGSELCALQDVLPKPLPTLTDDMLWTLRQFYDRLTETAPDAAPYVAVITMNRLAKPWMALKLPLMITRQTQDTLISATDMGLVGELLLGDLEDHASALRAARPQDPFDADELVMHLSGFTAVSNGIVKEIEIRRDGKWGQRLMRDRATVAETMESFMERAEREITGAIPMLKTGTYGGGPLAPDINHAPSTEKVLRAISYAKLLAGCRQIAAAASFGAAHKQVSDVIEVALKSYCEDILRELRAAEGGNRPHAEAYFNIAVELTSILFSPEEGDFLRRRGRAAMGYAAAA